MKSSQRKSSEPLWHSAESKQDTNSAMKSSICLDSRRPLSIELDARRLSNLSKQTDDIGSLLQLELRFWRNTLGPRAVTGLEIYHFGDYLESFEITGFLHHLSKEFEIKEPVYRFIIEPDEAETEVLALFKGLEFNHCQFALENTNPNTVNALQKPFYEAKSFNFSKVGLQIQYSENMKELAKNVELLRSTFQPDYTYIGGSTYKLCSEDIEKNDTLFESDVRLKKLDYLSIGPAASSTLNGQKIDALSDTTRYMTALQEGHLPLNEPCLIEPP